MSSAARTSAATLGDLARVEGKAELIAGEIFLSLKAHTRATGRGVAYTDNIGFAVPELASGRESFSPDASYYVGPLPGDDMDFIPGPPTFAAEVRSKNDYGTAAEAAIAAKRADYFQAGTSVVWDVDPRAQRPLLSGHHARAARRLSGGSSGRRRAGGPGLEDGGWRHLRLNSCRGGRGLGGVSDGRSWLGADPALGRE